MPASTDQPTFSTFPQARSPRSRPSSRKPFAIVAVTAAAALLTARAGNAPQSVAPPETSVPASAATPGPAGATSVRIGNFYVDKTLKPGPALDLYDTQPGQAATPILTAVPWGSVSAYVHPQENGSVVHLYVLPTGEDPVAKASDAEQIGGYQDDGSHLQETLVLGSEGSSGGATVGGALAGLSVHTDVEKGDDGNGDAGPVASPPPAGQAELLVSTTVVETENLSGPAGANVGYFFFVDASCDPPVNGDGAQEPGIPYLFPVSAPAQSLFPTAPGTHQISVVGNSVGQMPTCAALGPKQGQMSVDLTAGQQVLVYVYGTSISDLHLAVAPIQP